MAAAVGRWCGGLAGEAQLSRPPDVSMMQATDFADWHYLPYLWPLDRPLVWCILVEREVGSGVVIVREVTNQDAAQVPLAQDEDVVETLAPDRTDEPLREGILPRAAGRGEPVTDPHAFHALLEEVTVDRVAIAEEIGGRGVVRESVHDLLGGPCGNGVLGHVEVQDAAAMVGEHDEDEEDAQASGRNREEIGRD